MQSINTKNWMTSALLAAALPLASVASAATVTGIAVGGGEAAGPAVGIPPVGGQIEYFIPLRDDTTSTIYTGTYGDKPAGVFCAANGVGTCSDSGSGFGYDSAGALDMNIYFDLTLEPVAAAARLTLAFADLDLIPINDPDGFHESLTFSYWDTQSNGFVTVGSTIKNESELTGGAFAGAASTTPATLADPFSWHIDLLALGVLGKLNQSRALDGGFWIQLGFGSLYLDEHGNPKHGKNTSEFLTATLDVSPVPIPSAVWLFGSALIGFIGLSRRTRV